MHAAQRADVVVELRDGRPNGQDLTWDLAKLQACVPRITVGDRRLASVSSCLYVKCKCVDEAGFDTTPYFNTAEKRKVYYIEDKQ